jgi:hypothetical protein
MTMEQSDIWNENGEPKITASELWAEGEADLMAQADIQFEERWNAIEPEIPGYWEHAVESFREMGYEPEGVLFDWVISIFQHQDKQIAELVKEIKDLKVED